MKKLQKNEVGVRLRESETRYRRFFESAHDGILILNSSNAQIEDANPFLVRLLGYSKTEFLKKKLWDVGAFKNIKATKDNFEILQNQGYLRYDDLPLETKDGRLVHVEFVANSYMAGKTLVIQCNIRDMTERNKMGLMRETARLLEEEKLTISSIAEATHELRTPLAIIKGNVDLAMLRVGGKPKSPLSAFQAINYEIKHLSRIISDLTMITSQKGNLKDRLIYNKVDVKHLVTVVVERCQALSDKKSISITMGEIGKITIFGDQGYLEKMLVNLVKNSIFYGKDKGHIELAVRKSERFVTISVKDDGVGISKEDLPHIFERFYRADKSHSTGGKSTGLGLTIVKWIIEAHGGKIVVTSTENKGSIFNVSLPIKNKEKKRQDLL